jgi:EmrB/QacA subfamily drug resistance transporter
MPNMTSFVVSLAFFMEFIDTTAINTAIPAMAQSLQVEPVDLKVALISYLLSLATFIPISGWLADKFGPKQVFLTALLIFTLSSIWCGFANSLPELIIARFVQGLGGALNMPIGRLIIAQSFAKEELIHRMARVIMVGSLGVMLGPFIGGWITERLSWHWIFWVNVPVGLINILLGLYFLKLKKKKAPPPLDKVGFVLFGLSLAGFVFGLSALSETLMDVRIAILVITISIILMLLYFKHSRGLSNPIVKIDLFICRTFRVASIGSLISRLGFSGVPFLLPLLLQICFGMTAEISGLMLSPIALGIVLAKAIFLPFLRALGYKRFLIFNTFVSGLSIFLFAFVTKSTPLYGIGFLTFFYGLVMSLQFSAINSLAYADLSSEDFSAGTSISSTLQQLSQSFGVAISALFVRFFSYSFTESVMLTPAVFHYTFCAIAVITLATTVIFVQLKESDGQEMIQLNE